MKRKKKVRQRRPGIAATVGLVVEGDAEFAALPLLRKMFPACPPLKPTNLCGVGSDVAPVGIAKKIAPKIAAHWIADRLDVIVCIDRESRDLDAVGFAVAVKLEADRELLKYRLAGRFAMVVADRAFEAWLLADAAGLFARGHFKVRPGFTSFEGSIGAERKKGCVELNRLLSRPYSKTGDGPKLFRELEFEVARDPSRGGSQSLNRLLLALCL